MVETQFEVESSKSGRLSTLTLGYLLEIGRRVSSKSGRLSTLTLGYLLEIGRRVVVLSQRGTMETL